MKMRLKLIIFLLVVANSLNSCSLDDGDSPIINYEVLPVTNVEMPQTFDFGQQHSIPVMFEINNDCQMFAGFEVTSSLNERIVTVVAATTANACADEVISTQQTLNFLAASNGSYVFKFFTGLDSDNNPIYLEYTVRVEE